jgi:hypothetical protein
MPAPSGNGLTDLYVANSVQSGNGILIAEPKTSDVLRYDATTGAFLGTFVAPDSGGLKFPTFLTFTETDPTTLNYVDAGAAAAIDLTAKSLITTVASTNQPRLGQPVTKFPLASYLCVDWV